MPTKKNRAHSNHPDRAPFTLQEALGQPSEQHAPTGVVHLPQAVQGSTPVRGGSGSKVGRLSHGTDTPNKVSLPKHGGKKSRGLYPKSKD